MEHMFNLLLIIIYRRIQDLKVSGSHFKFFWCKENKIASSSAHIKSSKMLEVDMLKLQGKIALIILIFGILHIKWFTLWDLHINKVYILKINITCNIYNFHKIQFYVQKGHILEFHAQIVHILEFHTKRSTYWNILCNK